MVTVKWFCSRYNGSAPCKSGRYIFFLLILLYCYTNSTVCSDFFSSSRNPQISCSCLESIKIWNRSNSTRTIIEIIPKRPSIFGDSFLAFKYKIERIKNEGKRDKRRKKQNLMPYENLFVYHPKIKSNRLTWKEVCDWRNWSDIESIRGKKTHMKTRSMPKHRKFTRIIIWTLFLCQISKISYA